MDRTLFGYMMKKFRSHCPSNNNNLDNNNYGNRKLRDPFPIFLLLFSNTPKIRSSNVTTLQAQEIRWLHYSATFKLHSNNSCSCRLVSFLLLLPHFFWVCSVLTFSIHICVGFRVYCLPISIMLWFGWNVLNTVSIMICCCFVNII